MTSRMYGTLPAIAMSAATMAKVSFIAQQYTSTTRPPHGRPCVYDLPRPVYWVTVKYKVCVVPFAFVT
jgi:hypothetical protein